MIVKYLQMKKIVFLMLICLPFTGMSQRFNGGLLAGGLVSQVDGDQDGGYHKFGWLGGALVSLKISDRSSFQLEMEYIQKGARKNADSLTNKGASLTRLHYFEIPLLYQFTFAKRFQAEAGPAMDVLIGTYAEDENGLEQPIIVPYRSVTLNGIAGISCFISDHLKAGIRFNYSLMSIRDGYVYGQRKIMFEAGQYNNVLSLELSWYFKPRDY